MPKGITNETRSASLKKFKANPKINNGLCLGALVDVTVSDAEVKDDSNMTSFRGLSIPRLNFVFESQMDPVGVKKSTYIHSYLAIEHNTENHSGDGVWRWNQMSQMIKHFLEVYRDYAPFTKEEEAKLIVDFEDEDENGIFKEVEGQVVADAYRKFFENIVSLFKPGDKAIYFDANGKPKVVWMKLIIDIKSKQVNNGDFGFPGYPGEGVIELWKKDIPPSIYINVAKGENIVPTAPISATAPPVGSDSGGPATTGAELPSFLRGGGGQ